MGHWVTTEDDRHIFISDGGKVCAMRSQISRASGGTERGKALAARSKAAMTKPANRAHESGPGGMGSGSGKPSLDDRMTASADAAKVRAESARVRGDRTAELQAHKHRAHPRQAGRRQLDQEERPWHDQAGGGEDRGGGAGGAGARG